MNAPYSLRKKAVITITILFIPVLVSFLIGYSSNKKNLEKLELSNLSVIAEGYEGQIYQFVEMSRRRANDFASDGLIRGHFQGLTPGGKEKVASLNRHLLKNKKPLDETIHSIHLISPEGIVVSSSIGSAIGKDLSNIPFFINGKEGVTVYKRNLFIDGDIPLLLFSSPIREISSRKVIGLLVNAVLLDELNNVISGEFVRGLGAPMRGSGKPKMMEAYLVDKEKLMITESRFVKGARLNQAVDTPPVSACLESNRETSGVYLNYLDKKVAGVSACIPSMDWALLVEVDEDEIFAPLREMRNAALLAAITVAAIVGTMFFLFSKNIVARLREISGAANDIAAGNYGVTVPVRTKDEIGSLSESFNMMSQEIAQRSSALRESEMRFRGLIETTSDMVWEVDKNGVYTYVSPAVQEILGYDPMSIIGKTPFELMPEEEAKRVSSMFKTVSESRIGFNLLENTNLHSDGHEVILETSGVPVFDIKGKFSGYRGIDRDVTTRKRIEREKTRLSSIIETTSDFVATGDKNGRVLYYNRAARKMLGIGENEDIATIRIPDTHPQWATSLVLNEGIPTAIREGIWRGETAFLCRDGHEVPASQVIIAHKDPDGNVEFISTIARDMTQQKLAEMELKKLKSVLENSTNVVVITDKEGNIEYVNPMFEQVTGWSRDEVIGKNPGILSSGEMSKAEYAELWETILGGKSWRRTVKNKRKDGQTFWVNLIITPIKDAKGDITHFMSIQEDITEKKVIEERVEHLETHEGLTGLVNRMKFMELLSEWLYQKASNREANGALLLINIDGMKLLNSSLGHGIGDELLRRTARLLTDITKEDARLQVDMSTDAISGHLGGDEFAVFIPCVNFGEGMSFAEKVRRGVEGIHLRDGIPNATVSIGVALYPEHGTTAKELFIRADSAKNRAKAAGKNRSHLFSPDDKDLENARTLIVEKERIVAALKDDRFMPWFQPIMDIKSGKIHHYEALARLRDTGGKILFPNVFIHTAEIFGLIGKIDRAITEKAMRLQAEMGRQGRYLSFAMNLSGKNLGDEELLSFLRTKIKETGTDPDHLVFEITETAAVQDLSRAIKFIDALKDMGCHFSLDDFGVGYTSFTYLKEMSVDYLKIDGSFVKMLPESINDRLVVKSITDVAKGMGIKTVAEFVENDMILDILKELGVDYAQGYHIGKPAPELLPNT